MSYNKPGEFVMVAAARIIPGSVNGDNRLDIADGIFIPGSSVVARRPCSV